VNYTQTIEYLYNSLPVFHRIGGPAYKATLSNTIELDDYFHHPHTKFKTIHIAGTNGKGSVSHMIASVLQTAGYRTGLYTSPHLKDYRERIRIDGIPISEGEVINFVRNHEEILKRIQPSFFEMSVAMAFDYFAREKVEIAVIEVGMGGRLDSTNIITPLLSVISNISLDHTQFLGKSIEEIAREKAGIIKSGVPVIIGETQAETRDVFLNKALECNSDILFADMRYSASLKGTSSNRQIFEIEDLQGNSFSLEPDLLGLYQKKNIITVFAALNRLMKIIPCIDTSHLENGIRDTASRTGLRGRWEIIQKNPLIICDTAHNEAGIAMVVEQLSSMTFNQLHFVFGTVKDKDPSNVLKILPDNAYYYFTRANIPRALDELSLKEAADKYGLKGMNYSSVEGAIEAALKSAGKEDIIFIGGSNFIVAEALYYF
jgi:dihydrofolate synthase / folylpolyglutamate synthase